MAISGPIVVNVNSGNPCTVVPGFVNVGSGSTTVQWVNNTGGDIDILIPDHGISGNVRHLRISSHGSKNIITNKVPDGKYLYAVYCHQNKDFAVAHSHPEMIVP